MIQKVCAQAGKIKMSEAVIENAYLLDCNEIALRQISFSKEVGLQIMGM